MKDPSSAFAACIALLAATVACPAQERQDPQELARRVLAGGTFETSRYRRADDGTLQFDYFADLGGTHDGSPRWQPLCGERLEFALGSLDATDLFALLVHGPDDVLALTDAEFHLRTVGFDTSDVALRQRLLRPIEGQSADARRTELLDRMVAIDLLTRRGCKAAKAELTGLQKGPWPTELQQRARRALQRLGGAATDTDADAPRRLDPASLMVPDRFDLLVVVDHARLPRFDGLFADVRRQKSEGLAERIQGFARGLTPAMRNGCQRTVDAAGELPFALTHTFGAMRVDQSALFVGFGPGQDRPLVASWQAVGSFDAERWQASAQSLGFRDALVDAVLEVSAEKMHGALGAMPAQARPARAADLLGPDATALRVVIPKHSVIWSRLVGAPAAPQAALQLRLAARPTLELQLHAASDDAAERWRSFLQRQLPVTLPWLRQHAPATLAEQQPFADLLEALQGATFERRGRAVHAQVALPDLSRDQLMKSWSALR